MAEVTHIAELRNDNRLITPAQMLRQLADDLDSGRESCTSALVIMLRNQEEEFSVRPVMSNMNYSTGLSAMTLMIHEFCQRMTNP